MRDLKRPARIQGAAFILSLNTVLHRRRLSLSPKPGRETAVLLLPCLLLSGRLGV